MPSSSLVYWQSFRVPRLIAFDAQCARLGSIPENDENLRAYALLLSAHFQGYCRDLYAESAQLIVSRIRSRLQVIVQEQFTAHRNLDHGNPNLANIRADFERFGFTLDLPIADSANSARLNHLNQLNKWRNVAAHGGAPTGNPPTILDLQMWRVSCDGLAVSLDQIMYDELRRILRRKPW